MFIQIPSGAIIAHYCQLESGAWAVVTPSGKVLAPSFFELRNQYEFYSSINGAGGWVVLVPVVCSSLFSQPSVF